MRWVHFRMELSDPDGKQRAYWAQLGYGAQRHYSFELTSPGASSQEMDAEVSQILDSITAADGVSKR